MANTLLEQQNNLLDLRFTRREGMLGALAIATLAMAGCSRPEEPEHFRVEGLFLGHDLTIEQLVALNASRLYEDFLRNGGTKRYQDENQEIDRVEGKPVNAKLRLRFPGINEVILDEDTNLPVRQDLVTRETVESHGKTIDVGPTQFSNVLKVEVETESGTQVFYGFPRGKNLQFDIENNKVFINWREDITWVFEGAGQFTIVSQGMINEVLAKKPTKAYLVAPTQTHLEARRVVWGDVTTIEKRDYGARERIIISDFSGLQISYQNVELDSKKPEYDKETETVFWRIRSVQAENTNYDQGNVREEVDTIILDEAKKTVLLEKIRDDVARYNRNLAAHFGLDNSVYLLTANTQDITIQHVNFNDQTIDFAISLEPIQFDGFTYQLEVVNREYYLRVTMGDNVSNVRYLIGSGQKFLELLLGEQGKSVDSGPLTENTQIIEKLESGVPYLPGDEVCSYEIPVGPNGATSRRLLTKMLEEVIKSYESRLGDNQLLEIVIVSIASERVEKQLRITQDASSSASGNTSTRKGILFSRSDASMSAGFKTTNDVEINEYINLVQQGSVYINVVEKPTEE